jgi:hypothetical protein
MKRILVLSLLICLFAVPASAQSNTPYVIRSTRPISGDLRSALDVWLAADAPSTAPYYIVTHTSTDGPNTTVSMVGVNLESPDARWTFEDGEKIVWMGSVSVAPDWTVTYTPPVSAAPAKVAARRFAGGGSYLFFPFAGGTSAQYGPRGVHAAGYGTSGMKAVDLIGGDDMGASSMPPYAYAADAGSVDYVCQDSIQVAVRTHNTSSGDYFIYAHLLDNENLTEGHSFSQGDSIGALKYGTFDDTCGWAEQQSNHYHLHWAFTPASGHYQVGSCILTISSQVWDCDGQSVQIGGYLSGGGGAGTGDDAGSDGSGSVVNDPTFWDYILTGVLSLVDSGIVKLLPSHQPFEYTYVVFNVISLTLRLVWVFAASNLSFVWLGRVILVGFSIKAIFGIIWLVAFLFKAWKSLVPIFGA